MLSEKLIIFKALFEVGITYSTWRFPYVLGITYSTWRFTYVLGIVYFTSLIFVGPHDIYPISSWYYLYLSLLPCSASVAIHGCVHQDEVASDGATRDRGMIALEDYQQIYPCLRRSSSCWAWYYYQVSCMLLIHKTFLFPEVSSVIWSCWYGKPL